MITSEPKQGRKPQYHSEPFNEINTQLESEPEERINTVALSEPKTQWGSYGALRAKSERVSKRFVGFPGCGDASRGCAEVRGCRDGLPGGCQSDNNNDGLWLLVLK